MTSGYQQLTQDPLDFPPVETMLEHLDVIYEAELSPRTVKFLKNYIRKLRGEIKLVMD